MECPCPVTEEEEGRFTELLESFVLDRSSIPQAIAQGVSSLKDVRRAGRSAFAGDGRGAV